MLKDRIQSDKGIASLSNRKISILQCRNKKEFPKHKKIILNLYIFYRNHTATDKIFRNRKSVPNLEIKVTIWNLETNKRQKKIKSVVTKTYQR